MAKFHFLSLWFEEYCKSGRDSKFEILTRDVLFKLIKKTADILNFYFRFGLKNCLNRKLRKLNLKMALQIRRIFFYFSKILEIVEVKKN